MSANGRLQPTAEKLSSHDLPLVCPMAPKLAHSGNSEMRLAGGLAGRRWLLRSLLMPGCRRKLCNNLPPSCDPMSQGQKIVTLDNAPSTLIVMIERRSEW